MENIKLDIQYTGIENKQVLEYAKKVKKIHDKLHKNTYGKMPLGWLDLPEEIEKKEIEKIKKYSEIIRKTSDIFIVIGIGGSYLGARAVIEALSPNFYNSFESKKRNGPQIYFVGNNMNPDYINDLIELIETKDVSINVISKSGTTTEPAIAFRIFRELLENKYGIEEARERIYVTTDSKKGALKKLADNQGYTSFVIPDDIGGRYSVLTPVGLLPICVAGIDIEKILDGARFAQDKYSDDSLKYNDCYKYAVVRNILYSNDKKIEMLVSYEPKLQYMGEWWKQLFGESEGKEGKGLFPASAQFTTDLHSMGQYLQEGTKSIFETVINIMEPESDIEINPDEDNLDELNYLISKKLSYINSKAMEATIKAHTDEGTPNILINVEKLTEETVGQLIYFFELACAISGHILEVNPFDQPGVEKYKKNMFELLGKNN